MVHDCGRRSSQDVYIVSFLITVVVLFRDTAAAVMLKHVRVHLFKDKSELN